MTEFCPHPGTNFLRCPQTLIGPFKWGQVGTSGDREIVYFTIHKAPFYEPLAGSHLDLVTGGDMNEVDLVIGFLRRTDFRGLQYFLTPYPMLNQVTYIKEAIEVVAITSSLGEIKRFVELGDPNQKGAENLPEILFLVATVADMFIWEAEIEDTEPEGGVL